MNHLSKQPDRYKQKRQADKCTDRRLQKDLRHRFKEPETKILHFSHDEKLLFKRLNKQTINAMKSAALAIQG